MGWKGPNIRNLLILLSERAMILAYTHKAFHASWKRHWESTQGEFHKTLDCVPHVATQQSSIPVGFCTPLLMEPEEWDPTDSSGS